jgi:hypothetical protein
MSSSWSTRPQKGKNTTITALGATSKEAQLKGNTGGAYRVVIIGGAVHIRTGLTGDAATTADPVYEEGTELVTPEQSAHTHLYARAIDGVTDVIVHVCPIVAVRA